MWVVVMLLKVIWMQMSWLPMVSDQGALGTRYTLWVLFDVVWCMML